MYFTRLPVPSDFIGIGDLYLIHLLLFSYAVRIFNLLADILRAIGLDYIYTERERERKIVGHCQHRHRCRNFIVCSEIIGIPILRLLDPIASS